VTVNDGEELSVEEMKMKFNVLPDDIKVDASLVDKFIGQILKQNESTSKIEEVKDGMERNPSKRKLRKMPKREETENEKWYNNNKEWIEKKYKRGEWVVCHHKRGIVSHGEFADVFGDPKYLDCAFMKVGYGHHVSNDDMGEIFAINSPFVPNPKKRPMNDVSWKFLDSTAPIHFSKSYVRSSLIDQGADSSRIPLEEIDDIDFHNLLPYQMWCKQRQMMMEMW